MFWFKKAQESSPEFEWARVQQISILLDSKSTDEAERGLKPLSELNPDAEWALLELAKLKNETGTF